MNARFFSKWFWLWLAASAAYAVSAPHVLAYTIRDKINGNQNIKFEWTIGEGRTFPGFWFFKATCPDAYTGPRDFAAEGSLNWNESFPDFSGKACSFVFLAPEQAKDWKQTIIGPDGSSVVVSGNIERESPWTFVELALLPPILARIPDLAPIADSPDVTIYTAVNLGLYMNENPLGFLGGNWSVGQTLDELGVNIVAGEVSGLLGIYWATTPFEFDPDPAGRGFTPIDGDTSLLNSATYPYDIIVLQEHVSVPGPATGLLLGSGLLALLYCDRRRRKRAA